ncbi:ABC transporter permease [Helicobacter ailurogastricus]|uniref:ABC-type multidrug transport system, permease component n=1 Tax=Helicobacter ailurogastricus TaxID=1578720 RepID=A0A0K2X5V5_9HELI|nr:ABC transporter permease [Helicobacter ailurogastricus]CRF41852.1 ABC-type multidrug transport system, permease component [Helicobacter ailurogastricus]CRF42939.1 ABC-type multidrug transport system, permease component [Helicobacter ailurogastricus]CRF45009.1 ABC-type multidrug transport system, permease component [Helicobacter ailurogastricus]
MWAKFFRQRFAVAVCVAPLVFGLVMVVLFYKQIPTRLNIGVVDLDNSHLSHEMVRSLNANSALNVAHFYSGLDQAKPFLASKKIYGVVVLPKNLERQVKLGVQTPVALYYNAEYVLVGKTLLNAFLLTLATLEIKQDVAKNLSIHGDLITAKALAFPLHVNLHTLYNEHNNYAQFLLMAILPCMWQILAALGMFNFLQVCQNSREVWAALGLNTLIFSAWGALMLFYLKPYNAHWGLMLLSCVLLVAAISSVVVGFFVLLQEPMRVASFIALYTAPSLAFVGVTYPTDNMPALAQCWSALLPVTYFLKATIALDYYQAGLDLALKAIGHLPIFWLFYLLGIALLAQRERAC